MTPCRAVDQDGPIRRIVHAVEEVANLLICDCDATRDGDMHDIETQAAGELNLVGHALAGPRSNDEDRSQTDGIDESANMIRGRLRRAIEYGFLDDREALRMAGGKNAGRGRDPSTGQQGDGGEANGSVPARGSTLCVELIVHCEWTSVAAGAGPRNAVHGENTCL